MQIVVYILCTITIVTGIFVIGKSIQLMRRCDAILEEYKEIDKVLLDLIKKGA